MKRFLTSLLVFSVSLGVLSACKKKKPGPDSIDDVPVSETLNLPGLNEPVQVIRDEWYRPHIYASNEEDLFRVFGYIQAKDRFVQMDFQRRLPRGQLAELAGGLSPSLVELDFSNRLLDLDTTIQQIIDGLDPNGAIITNGQAYADGVNYYIQQLKSFDEPLPLEYTLVGYPVDQIPEWTIVDSYAVGRLLAMDLSWDANQKAGLSAAIQAISNMYAGQLLEGMVCDNVLQYNAVADGSIVDPSAPRSAPPPCTYTTTVAATVQQAEALDALSTQLLKNPFNTGWAPDRGSNNWVVGPAASASGHAILANDPHLGLSIPSVWHQVHLNTTRAGGDLDVVGVSFPGAPAVLIGHNGQIVWGVTNVGPDVTDNYVETYSQGTGTGGVDQVMYNGNLVDLVPRDETVEIRNGQNVTTETRTFLDIPHRPGAIIPNTFDGGTNTALSWRWVGFDPFNDLAFFDGMARAHDANEVLANIDANHGIPSAPQNVIWATADGDIGYKANGRYPIRDDDDGDPYTNPAFLPLPGTGAHEWIGYVDDADVPQVINPESGFIATANQDPFGNTLDGDPLNDSTPYIGFNWDFGPRGSRINERLQAAKDDGGVTVADMMDIQADHKSPLGARMTPFILDAIDGNAQYQEYFDLLTGWGDRGYRAASGAGPGNIGPDEDLDAAATALFNAWLVEFQGRVLNDELASVGIGMGSQGRAGLLLTILEHPDWTATYDSGSGDSVLFDDITTGGTTEARDEIIVEALSAALDQLASSTGFGSSNPSDWDWGSKHTLTLEHNLGVASLARPTESDPDYPNGFPHHSDNYAVDASNFGITNHGYTYGSGPSVRVVTHAVPGKFKMMMSFPGGVSGDSANDHYDDQLFDNYIFNEYRELWYYEKDVAKHGQEHVVLEP